MPSNFFATLGAEIYTNKEIRIGDVERNSGLYILGKPGMGKSALLINMLKTDIHAERGVFFLDPHGEAISELLRRVSCDTCPTLFNAEDKDYSFGINLLHCPDSASLTEVTKTYARAY